MYLLSNNELAVSIFNGLAEQMTGKRIERTVSGDVPGDLIVIGSDSDNCFVAEKVLDGSWVLPPYRSGSDDFFIRTFEEQGRRVLLLGGGICFLEYNDAPSSFMETQSDAKPDPAFHPDGSLFSVGRKTFAFRPCRNVYCSRKSFSHRSFNGKIPSAAETIM